jgi:serine phosphatase RsbU (regulator of sigma subunit)
VSEPAGNAIASRAGFVAPEDDFARRLQQLAHVTARLAAAETIDAVATVVVSHVVDAIGAAVSTLMLREGDRLRLVATHGVRPGVQQEFATFDINDANPAGEAVRTARPVVVSDVETIREKYAAIADRMPQDRSLVCLPLTVGTETLGVIGLTFEENWLPGQRELDLLTTFADSCAQAVRRIRATEEAGEKARHLTFLAEVSAELARSIDYRETLANVAQLAVPMLADWCTVALVQDGRLTTVALAHADPEKVAWAWQIEHQFPIDIDAPTGVPNVVRTGTSELHREITDEMLAASARDDEHLRIARELDLGSALVVPLTARGRTVGAMSMLRTSGRRPFDEADLVTAEDLARRAAVAIENARLHRQTEDIALQLQRAVLPDDLAALTGWRVAAHYTPGGRAEVGGDFYDAVDLGSGRLAVFIGDVMGHGVEAAAAMAQMRASVRAFLSIDPAPAAVVGRLDAMYERLHISEMATLAYLLIDSGDRRVRFVLAGHYPPLVVSADGSRHFVAALPQRPLGAGADSRVEASEPLEPDEVLLLYTDGLVERRDESIDDGLARLERHAGLLARAPLDAGLRALVDALRDPAGLDDVTALAVRVPPADA